MGMNPMGGSKSHCDTFARASNPNPAEWELLKGVQFNTACVLLVRYFGCTNFEGRKVMVFENLEVEQLLSGDRKFLDPHFSEDGLGPLARFEPTKHGWDLACRLAIALDRMAANDAR